MKGNTKKLAVMVMIVALAIVLPVAMVSADDHAGKKFIQGTYAVTGMNGVLLAPFGFDPQSFEPINGVAFPVGPQSWKGTYTFHKNGTVDSDVIIAGIDPAIPSPACSWVYFSLPARCFCYGSPAPRIRLHSPPLW